MSDFERWLRDTIDGQLWEILACIAGYLAFGILLYAFVFFGAALCY